MRAPLEPLLIRTPLPREVVSMLHEAGHDPVRTLRRAGLPTDLDTPEPPALPLRGVMAFYEEAAVILDEPDLGLHLANRIDRGLFGLCEFGVRAAPTVREGLLQLARYTDLINGIQRVAIDEDERRLRYRLTIPGSAIGLGRHLNEFNIALLVLQGRAITGTPFVPHEVFFAHRRPASIARHVALFETRNIAFGRECSGFVLPRAFVDAPLRTADLALMAVIDAHAQHQRATTNVRQGFLAQVQATLRERLASQTPTLELTARWLGMSARTLQRRLADEGTGFQQVLDGVREALARMYLEQSLPVGEIAALLGYSEVPAFRRAFKRWTGTPPEGWRRSRSARTSARPDAAPEQADAEQHHD